MAKGNMEKFLTEVGIEVCQNFISRNELKIRDSLNDKENKGLFVRTYLTYLNEPNIKYLLKTLINLGANINDTDEYRNTILNIATRENKVEIINLMLGNEADPNISNSVKQSPLQWAYKNKNIDILIALLKKGADINKIISTQYSLIETVFNERNWDFFRVIVENAKMKINISNNYKIKMQEEELEFLLDDKNDAIIQILKPHIELDDEEKNKLNEMINKFITEGNVKFAVKLGSYL